MKAKLVSLVAVLAFVSAVFVFEAPPIAAAPPPSWCHPSVEGQQITDQGIVYRCMEDVPSAVEVAAGGGPVVHAAIGS